MMIHRIAAVSVAVLCLVASGCRPEGEAPKAAPSAPVAPAAVAKPLVSDWRVQTTAEDVRAAVDAMGVEKQMSAAEADALLALPDWGLWSDMTQEQARAFYQKIPLDLALKYVHGSGKNELLVFTDPHNQNDRRLLGLLLAGAKRMDATIYVFLLPSDPPVSNPARILCSEDPEKAWQDWSRQIAVPAKELSTLFTSRLPEEDEASRWKLWEDRHPETLGCDGRERAEKIDALASELGVAFTPTLVFAHGRAWPGQFPEMSDIEETWAYAHGRLGFVAR